jgi:transposase
VWQDSKDQTIYLKKVAESDGEVRVLVKSCQRAVKERAMDNLQHDRFVAELEKVKLAVSRGKPKKAEKIERRIGRIEQRFKTAAKHHDVKVVKKEGVVIDIIWTLKEPDVNRHDLDGTYVITTSHTDLLSQDIWELYITLTQVENAFRCLKSDLGLRPVYHQLEDRTCAHLFISVLAYHIMAAIERDLRNKGNRSSWKTVRDSLETLQRVTINYINESDHLKEIRVSTVPEPHHVKILDALGVVDPLSRRKSIIGKLA